MKPLMALTAKAREKRGDEMVEASIVFPIVILTVLSLIMLLIYFYSCLHTQIKVHNNLIEGYVMEETVFNVAKGADSTASHMGGIVSTFMKKEFAATYYEINEPRIIRLGETINDAE